MLVLQQIKEKAERLKKAHSASPFKVLSLFSGIGAFEKALDNLQLSWELVNYCEIDPSASHSYSLIHRTPESKNLWDITKVNEKKIAKVDLITYGFPCQDISIAGKQRGLFDENGNKTRSGLFFDALRIIQATKPKVAIAENVKALTTARFKEQFDLILQSLNDAGYNSYFKVLNARDRNIPQERERVFIVSIRKDIDTGKFSFPCPQPSTKTIIDIMERNVSSKYNLSEKMLNGMMNTNYNIYKLSNRLIPYNGKAHTIVARFSGAPQIVQDLDTNKLRTLTPKECWRLMGFSDNDFEKAAKANSNTQLYKQAGNSICVPVIQAIIKQLILGGIFNE